MRRGGGGLYENPGLDLMEGKSSSMQVRAHRAVQNGRVQVLEYENEHKQREDTLPREISMAAGHTPPPNNSRQPQPCRTERPVIRVCPSGRLCVCVAVLLLDGCRDIRGVSRVRATVHRPSSQSVRGTTTLQDCPHGAAVSACIRLLRCPPGPVEIWPPGQPPITATMTVGRRYASQHKTSWSWRPFRGNANIK